jgi:hypothetical protein
LNFLRNIENRQEFDVCNRDSLKNECLFKLYLPMKTTIKEVIRLIAERIEYSEQQIILQKPSTYISYLNSFEEKFSFIVQHQYQIISLLLVHYIYQLIKH